MKELPQDRPYRFRPPMTRRWLSPILGWLNREWYLRRTYRVGSMVCEGLEEVQKAVAAGDAVLLAPNHADHADVHVMYEVLTGVGIEPRFMGAREIFEAGALNAFALQSCGVFSVDRDGADLAAVKMAMGILEEGRHPLVMYPEGEIYHHHEWLDPLHEGLASILLRVAKRLPDSRVVKMVPVVFRFQCGAEMEATFGRRLDVLERHLGWKPRPDLSVMERLSRLGAGAIALKETEYFGNTEGGVLPGSIVRLCERLLEDVESRHGRDPRVAISPPERVRALRYRIRKALLDGTNPPDESARRGLLQDLDRVHTAYQAYSYPGNYLAENPSVGRVSETLIKLEEDLMGRATYPARRTVQVSFGEPLEVCGLLRSGSLPEKGAAAVLTSMLEKRMWEMLNRGSGLDLLGGDGGPMVSPQE